MRGAGNDVEPARLLLLPFERAHQVRHFDRHCSRLSPFIAALAAGTIHSLLHVIGGQDAERNRHTGFKTGQIQPVGSAPGNVVEVRRITPHNSTDRDNRIAAAGQFLGRNREFPRARNLHQADVFKRASLFFEHI